jgi:putative glutathione S-transferase
VDWLLSKENGWRFGYNGDKDPNNNFEFLKQVYFLSEPEYEGRFTVPILFDKKTNKIVNNESSEIIRILNSAFNRFAKNPTLDLYPEDKREAIDEVNEWVYEKFNNGVYKAGFATKQKAYEEAYDGVFEAMDRMEEILSQRNYLAGDTFTEADVRAFSTLVRFDVAYFGIFKVNRQQLITFKNLWAYTKELYQRPEFKQNVYFDHIKHGYYSSMLHINPTGVVPKGPNVNFDEPHGRERK